MIEKMKFETPNLTNENKAKIAALFPGVVADGKVNFDLLRSMLGEEVFADEAYEYAKKLLKEHRNDVEKLVATLMEKEVVTKDEFDALFVK